MFNRWHHRRHITRCNAQWVDVCSLLANALRAGLNVPQAIAMAATETAPPLAEELQRVVADMAVGKRLDTALTELAQRIPGEGITIVADAVAVLHATGGNLITIFDRVVDVVREQRRVQQRIHTLTSQGIMTGAIVAAMPFVLLAIVACLMPQFVTPLFTTLIGRCLLGGAIMLQALGMLWMQRIVRIRV